MNKGFIPALGTPLDENGNFMEESFRTQIERQIEAGCCAVLTMGSMGQQAFIRSGETPKVARAAVEQVNGRVPVFVGAMDCSIRRAQERIAALEDLKLDALVFTAPYYEACPGHVIMNYYRAVAASTRHDIMLYDLPPVTQAKITYDMVVELKRDLPNLRGIKSADLQMLRKLKLLGEVPADFVTCFSGLDIFDIGYKWGITNYLDGMVDCTPANFCRMDKAFRAGDFETAGKCLNNVVELRDFFLKRDLWPSFTAAMNQLGFAGSFHPDYNSPLRPGAYEEIREEMIKIGEL